MFTIVWDQPAFDQMNAIVLWYPLRRRELAAALRSLDRELHQRADTWGEARETDLVRLGYVGSLSVLIRVDPTDQVVTVMEVRLLPDVTR
jgi:hypothetical protein